MDGMTTPFELMQQRDLEVEQLRFANEWLFPWHSLNVEGRIVDVDRFDGGRIRVGGFVFGDQLQLIFWQAVERYFDQKIHSVLQKWDRETMSYPAEQRLSSLSGTERLLDIFVAGVMGRAARTDQVLRGRGNESVDVPMKGAAAHSHARAEIIRLAEAHRALLLVEETKMRRSDLGRIIDAISFKPGLWGLSIDLKKLFRKGGQK